MKNIPTIEREIYYLRKQGEYEHRELIETLLGMFNEVSMQLNSVQADPDRERVNDNSVSALFPEEINYG